MIVTYNGYTHLPYEVSVVPTSTRVRTPRGEPFAVDYALTLQGQLHGSTQANLKANIEALLNAYSSDGQDFSLSWNDGTKTPDLNITGSNTLGGVQVVTIPTLSPANPAEYSFYWDYTIQLKARVVTQNVSTLVWQFSESIELVGNGGAQKVMVPLKRKRPQEQNARNYTVCQASQSGEAVGLLGYPRAPSPRWPTKLINESDAVRRISPTKLENGLYQEFKITWNYRYQSEQPFTGNVYPSRSL